MIGLKKILVATDFSETSEAALNYGRALARSFGSTLHVLHVAEDLMARADDAYMGATDLAGETEESARGQLDRLLSVEDRRDLGATPVVWSSSSPAYTIAVYARDAGTDLIVMGTHGRGAVARFLMGSVAEEVVRIAPCPVLTVHHPEHEFVLVDNPVLATATA